MPAKPSVDHLLIAAAVVRSMHVWTNSTERTDDVFVLATLVEIFLFQIFYKQKQKSKRGYWLTPGTCLQVLLPFLISFVLVGEIDCGTSLLVRSLTAAQKPRTKK